MMCCLSLNYAHARSNKKLLKGVKKEKVYRIERALDQGADIHYRRDMALRLVLDKMDVLDNEQLLFDSAPYKPDTVDAIEERERKKSTFEFRRKKLMGILRTLVQKGADVETDPRLLSQSVYNNDCELIRLFAAGMKGKKIEVDALSQKKFVSHTLSKKGHVELLQLLIENDIVRADVANNVEVVVWHGKVKLVELFLTRGADVNGNDGAVLRVALEKGHVDIVKLLLDGGAKAEERELSIAVEKGDIELVRLLLTCGKGVSVNNDGGRVLGSVRKGRLALTGKQATKKENGPKTKEEVLELIEELLTNKPKVGVEVFEQIEKLLINHAANYEVALCMAAECGLFEAVQTLVLKGADVKYKNSKSFRTAVAERHVHIARFLVNNGADVNAKCSEGLITAVENEDDDMVDFFFGYDINMYACDAAIAIAVKKSNSRLSTKLRRHRELLLQGRMKVGGGMRTNNRKKE